MVRPNLSSVPFQSPRKFALLCCAFICTLLSGSNAHAQGTGQLELSVIDSESKEPIAVRIQLRNARGKLISIPKSVKIGRQTCFDGTIVLDLAAGHYAFQMERGPEYRIRTGTFEIRRGASDNKQVDMQRFVDMASEGWYSGDIDLNHRPRQLKTLMLAEDLRIAAVRAWPVTRNVQRLTGVQRLGNQRLFAENVACDDRLMGRIGFCELENEIAIPKDATEFPSAFAAVSSTRKQDRSHIDLATLTHADLPTWIASNQVDTVGLLNANVLHEDAKRVRAIGRRADPTIYEGPLGPGRWSISTYYELLNCGLRIAPSAGSGSGMVDNPVGYNRVYVHRKDFTWDNWWQGLRQGRTLITNGPMLRARVNDQLPGHVFYGRKGDTVELESILKLSTREKIAYLQIIKNGETAAEVRLDELAKAGGVLPRIEFNESGWLLIRAVCENAKTLHYATTAPYYVEFDGKQRVSKRSCQFFQDWTIDRIKELENSLRQRPRSQRESVLRYHRAGLEFWQKQITLSNAP